MPLVAAQTQAVEWQVEPSVTASLVYSDNIDRDTRERDDVITEVAPGVRIRGEGHRLNLDLNYNLQTLTYADNTDRNNINHRLRAGADSELIRDHFFIDGFASLDQELVDRRDSASSDNISGSDNLRDVQTYSINPRWEQRLGNVANATVRYGHDQIKSEGSRTDSETNRIAATVTQGTGFSSLFFNFDYRNDQTDFSDGSNGFNDTRIINGLVGYQLSRQFSVFVRGSDQEYEFSGTRGANQPDDKQYGIGGTWQPNPRFSLTVVANRREQQTSDQDRDFRTAALSWAPSSRTSLQFDYGNSFFGETYTFNFTHRSRHTQWFASYNEGVSDFSREFLLALRGGRFCQLLPGDSNDAPSGECILSESDAGGFLTQDGDTFIRTEDFDVSGTIGLDNTFIAKNLRGGFTVTGARNTINVTVSNLRREFISNTDNSNERDFIIRTRWTHQLAPRTTAALTVARTNRGFDNGEEDRLNDIELRIERRVSGDSNLSLTLSREERSGDGNNRDFDENRITLSFTKFL